MESTLDWSQETMVSQLPLFWVWRKETALGRKGAWVKVLALEFTSLSHLGQDITLCPSHIPYSTWASVSLQIKVTLVYSRDPSSQAANANEGS